MNYNLLKNSVIVGATTGLMIVGAQLLAYNNGRSEGYHKGYGDAASQHATVTCEDIADAASTALERSTNDRFGNQRLAYATLAHRVSDAESRELFITLAGRTRGDAEIVASFDGSLRDAVLKACNER